MSAKILSFRIIHSPRPTVQRDQKPAPKSLEELDGLTKVKDLELTTPLKSVDLLVKIDE